MSYRRFGCHSFFALVLWYVSAVAHAFPDRALTLLVGFSPGGSVGQQAEVMAEILEEQLHYPVTLLYFPGAGGGKAAAMLATSSPDGHILQYAPSHTYTFDLLANIATFDTQSFDFIAALSREQLAFIASSEAPYQNWEELLAFAHAQGELVFASQTASDRFLIHYIAQQEGINVRTVPTSGGVESLLLLRSGNVDIAYGGGSYLQEVNDGHVRALLALDTQPLKALPDVPTLSAAGYDLPFSSLRLVAVPKGIPSLHRRTLEEALLAVAEDPRFLEVTEKKHNMPIMFKQGDALNNTIQTQIHSLQRPKNMGVWE